MAPNQLLIALRSYTIALYKELSEDPDYPINYHYAVGGLRLITDENQLDACRHVISVAKSVGVDFDLIDPKDAASRNPLLDTKDLLAALWDPLDGDIDPAQLCQALARRSRRAGAEIYRFNPVKALTQKSNGEWIVHTKNGDVTCEHIVNAAGYRVNEIGTMLGVEYPVVSLEHMYFITEPIAELERREKRVAMVRCPRDTFYMRQEKTSLLVGVYEHDCKLFGWDGIDPNFVNSLCPNDLDRCLPKLESIFDRVPVLKEVGIKSIVNGPITYSADAGPLIGKLPGRHNVWSMNGVRVGIGEGGGYGKILAQMMVHGEAEWDTWQLDPRRITSFANRRYTAMKAIEDYQNEFRWHMPHEHRPAGRPCKMTPLYPTLKARGAAFGLVNGWERTLFFKPSDAFEESHTYKFANWHQIVAKEVGDLSAGVALAEISGFNRYQIKGQGAGDWLDGLVCSRIPKSAGKVGLAYFLTERGNVLGEATIAMLDRDRFLYCSAAAAEAHDMDWLLERLPAGSEVAVTSLTDSHTTLIVAGPRSREFLQAATAECGWSRQSFPPLSIRRCYVGPVEVLAMSVSYSGELAFELHIPNNQLLIVYSRLIEIGADYRLTSFGTYAIESMRLEKGYGHWKADFITEYNPIEAGLERFVDMGKGFVGKAGLEAQLERGLRRKRVNLILDSKAAPAQPGESVFKGKASVGAITSAAWGYRTGNNIAMAYIDPELAKPGEQLTVYLLGRPVLARVADLCLYDPSNERWRG